jgi:menaquinone-dependent protoporphyrinogen IX oxidase
MPKAVVVYVTRTGHAKALAEDIAKALGSEAKEIIDLTGRKGPIGYMRAGAQASSKAASPITDPGVDLSGAAAVVLVQPVWAGNLCPPMRTWFQAHQPELAGKRIGFLATNKGSDPAALRQRVEAELGPLSAFALLRETVSAAERDEALKGFEAALVS